MDLGINPMHVFGPLLQAPPPLIDLRKPFANKQRFCYPEKITAHNSTNLGAERLVVGGQKLATGAGIASKAFSL
jgi:hypothetical protein